jgi:hypothetical protein
MRSTCLPKLLHAAAAAALLLLLLPPQAAASTQQQQRRRRRFWCEGWRRRPWATPLGTSAIV